MAKILPDNTELPVIMETEYASFTFEYSLDANETFTSLKIISTEFPDYILIENDTFSGTFVNVFKLPDGSIKYRIGFDYGESNSFADLPPKGTADIYSYTAPKKMLEYFDVVVELKYSDGSDLNIIKTYKQPIQGNWSTFKDAFINYVRG